MTLLRAAECNSDDEFFRPRFTFTAYVGPIPAACREFSIADRMTTTAAMTALVCASNLGQLIHISLLFFLR